MKEIDILYFNLLTKSCQIIDEENIWIFYMNCIYKLYFFYIKYV